MAALPVFEAMDPNVRWHDREEKLVITSLTAQGRQTNPASPDCPFRFLQSSMPAAMLSSVARAPLLPHGLEIP